MQRYSGSRDAKQVLRGRLAGEFVAAIEALEKGEDPAQIRTRLESTRELFAEFSDHDESMVDAFERIIAIVFSSWEGSRAVPLSLAAVAREEVAYFHRDLRRLPADRLIFSASFDPWVRADPAHVRRLVDNLIMNAAEALQNDQGAVQVEVDLHSVLAERQAVGGALPTGNHATLTVRDEGRGLDPAQIDEIFRAGYSSKDDHAGLGLTYVRQAVEDARGHIEVLSEEGGGTAIRVHLPLAEGPAA